MTAMKAQEILEHATRTLEEHEETARTIKKIEGILDQIAPVVPMPNPHPANGAGIMRDIFGTVLSALVFRDNGAMALYAGRVVLRSVSSVMVPEGSLREHLAALDDTESAKEPK